MSHFQTEKGTFKIPLREWSSVKSTLVNSFNEATAANYSLALTAYGHLFQESAEIRNFNYRQSLFNFLSRYDMVLVDIKLITNSMFPENYDKRKPLKPKKKNFPIANNQTTKYFIGNTGAYFEIDNKNRQLTWKVPQGNLHVQLARKHPVTKAVFTKLDSVSWGRKHGGAVTRRAEQNGHWDTVVPNWYGLLGAHTLDKVLKQQLVSQEKHHWLG